MKIRSIWVYGPTRSRTSGARSAAPLAVIFRDPQPERAAERKLATNLLADYAADRPEALADLAMDADAAQFAVIFPKAGAHGEKAIAKWRAEIAKRPAAIADKTVFESKGTIADDDAKVKPGKFAPLSSKRFEVRLKGGTKYRIAMTSTEVDSFLVVHDKAGKEVAFDDDGGGDLECAIGLHAAAGRHVCGVRGRLERRKLWRTATGRRRGPFR